MDLFEKIQVSASYIKERISYTPQIGMILGSGLGGLMDIIKVDKEIPYSDIPFFPVTTVKGHGGSLVSGTLHEKPIVIMTGRFHYYEGYSMEEVTFPIRVMKALGAHTLIISNAAGGMNPAFKIGDFMIIKDHVNLFPEHPLRGHNDERLGVRFPDMSEPYDSQLIQKAQKIAHERGIDIHTGVYAGLQGPTFETKAEYKMLHIIGCDAVGMSTVPEVIVALHGGMRVFAASVITDVALSDHLERITHEQVLAASEAAAPKFAAFVAQLIAEL